MLGHILKPVEIEYELVQSGQIIHLHNFFKPYAAACGCLECYEPVDLSIMRQFAVGHKLRVPDVDLQAQINFHRSPQASETLCIDDVQADFSYVGSIVKGLETISRTTAYVPPQVKTGEVESDNTINFSGKIEENGLENDLIKPEPLDQATDQLLRQILDSKQIGEEHTLVLPSPCEDCEGLPQAEATSQNSDKNSTLSEVPSVTYSRCRSYPSITTEDEEDEGRDSMMDSSLSQSPPESEQSV